MWIKKHAGVDFNEMPMTRSASHHSCNKQDTNTKKCKFLYNSPLVINQEHK